MKNELIKPTASFQEKEMVEKIKIAVTASKNQMRSRSKPLEILFITTFPPKECGIATYSQDLLAMLEKKFNSSLNVLVCPLAPSSEIYEYEQPVFHTLDTNSSSSFLALTTITNSKKEIDMVMIQHEFGLFRTKEAELLTFLKQCVKPVIIAFHTVLPKPDKALKNNVQSIASHVAIITVMTALSKKILIEEYHIPAHKIEIIAHGTHLVHYTDKNVLKKQYKLEGKKVLSTFGFLGPGKSIETTLDALPEIIKSNADVQFLIIGKTHPSLQKEQGEKYRDFLKQKVISLQLDDHVQFINEFVPLSKLLDYLQLSDIYLFTSKDPNQAVSGTFSYAVSCGCPIISTPIPHALEVIKEDMGILIDFMSSDQLRDAVMLLLKDDLLRKKIRFNCLNQAASNAWENAAIDHIKLFNKVSKRNINIQYTKPVFKLDHLIKMTTDFGIIQFCKINNPDPDSGYTLDDNSRALVTLCRYYQKTKDVSCLKYIHIYFNFIQYCFKSEGYFLNYVDIDKKFTPQNKDVNLADSNGRAIWALGHLLSISSDLPTDFSTVVEEAEDIIRKCLSNIVKIHSTRAMAFIIKGLYFYQKHAQSTQAIEVIKELSNRIVQMYRHEEEEGWEWFESYLTYGNSVLPEALLCAWMSTGEDIYKTIAKSSFDFLLLKIFEINSIRVISNQKWLKKGENYENIPLGGEQPIDVAYTILALKQFDAIFPNEGYRALQEGAFNWFLGDNHLRQIIYNPCTTGCYDGLEENNVNLNQGAESTVSYLLSRLAFDL